jgi:hypothetical protein
MEPIISPWLIYLIGMVDGLHVLFIASFLVLGILLIIMLIITGFAYLEDDDDLKNISKKSRFLIPVFITVFCLSIVVPTKNTVIGMIVAQQITPDNVKAAINAGKDFKDEVKKDVLDIILAITNEKTRNKKEK